MALEPYYRDEWLTVLEGDCREVMRGMEPESVHCVVTSPPYWALRDYGTPGQLGLEPTPEAYVAALVDVFREVRRVLRADGTVWLNLGDSYASTAPGTRNAPMPKGSQANADEWANWRPETPPGLKPKDLVGIPWRVAFALQADGWVLRSEVIWAKPNPMPESVTDRPTKSHEQLFLLSKAKWVGPERGRFADISDQDARWLAMFFDTEGNIVIKRAQMATGRLTYGTQIAFANTSRALLDTARAIVGEGVIHERPGRNAPMFYWQVSNQAARDLLYRIYPYLIVKRRQGALGIYLQDLLAGKGRKRPGGYRSQEHTDWLEWAWVTMKSLNHFGTPDLSAIPEPEYGRWDSQPYFYDADAVREPNTPETIRTSQYRLGIVKLDASRNDAETLDRFSNPAGRNLRSVWTVATAPYPGAHFATFPPALVMPCIKAGTSERGVCGECGAPWERVVERATAHHPNRWTADLARGTYEGRGDHDSGGALGLASIVTTTGWRPTCAHTADPIPAVVLDPFAGTGTVGIVSAALSRRAVLIDLNAEYLRQCLDRNRQMPLGVA